MAFQPFSVAFPERGVRETRYFENRDRISGLPDGTYDFVEFFCDDPDCPCDCVEIHIFHREAHTPGRPPEDVAVLRWGWIDPDDFTPRLISARNTAAQQLLDVFNELLEDPAYPERLAVHYLDYRATLPKPTPRPQTQTRPSPRRRKLKRRKKR